MTENTYWFHVRTMMAEAEARLETKKDEQTYPFAIMDGRIVVSALRYYSFRRKIMTTRIDLDLTTVAGNAGYSLTVEDAEALREALRLAIEKKKELVALYPDAD